MKRKFVFAAGLFMMIFTFNSCDELSNCKVCQQNSYNSSGGLITAGSETEYCDAELIAIQATPDATVGGVTTKWECR